MYIIMMFAINFDVFIVVVVQIMIMFDVLCCLFVCAYQEQRASSSGICGG